MLLSWPIPSLYCSLQLRLWRQILQCVNINTQFVIWRGIENKKITFLYHHSHIPHILLSFEQKILKEVEKKEKGSEINKEGELKSLEGTPLLFFFFWYVNSQFLLNFLLILYIFFFLHITLSFSIRYIILYYLQLLYSKKHKKYFSCLLLVSIQPLASHDTHFQISFL